MCFSLFTLNIKWSTRVDKARQVVHDQMRRIKYGQFLISKVFPQEVVNDFEIISKTGFTFE